MFCGLFVSLCCGGGFIHVWDNVDKCVCELANIMPYEK